MKKSMLLAVALSIVLVACGADPRDQIVLNDRKQWTPEFIQSLNKLNKDEQALFIAYYTRVKLREIMGGKGIPDGMTVRKAIEEEKAQPKEKS